MVGRGDRRQGVELVVLADEGPLHASHLEIAAKHVEGMGFAARTPRSGLLLAGTEALPKNLNESTIRPVAKSTFIDLLDPKWGLKGADMPEKIEGLTFGPSLPGNRRALLMSIDNDFESAEDSRLWVFSVPENL